MGGYILTDREYGATLAHAQALCVLHRMAERRQRDFEDNARAKLWHSILASALAERAE